MHSMHARLSALDLNLMVALHALLTEASVTRAARRISLSQSAVSHALGRLRLLIGDPLLVRSGRRLELTPRARALLPALERGLGELDGALRGEPPFAPATTRRFFTLGLADYAQAVLLGPLLARLQKEAPAVGLSAVAFPDVIERMDAGTMDLALMPTTTLPPGFSSSKLFSDRFVCMVRRGHPRVRGPRLSLATYLSLGHVVVAPTGQSGSLVDTELGRRGLERHTAVRVSSFLTAPVVVTESDLVSTGPERLWRSMVGRYPIRLLPPPLRLGRFDIHLVWHDRWQNDPAHRWLRQLITEVS
jgi:DNA-binding transcriptional LysR family regulator